MPTRYMYPIFIGLGLGGSLEGREVFPVNTVHCRDQDTRQQKSFIVSQDPNSSSISQKMNIGEVAAIVRVLKDGRKFTDRFGISRANLTDHDKDAERNGKSQSSVPKIEVDNMRSLNSFNSDKETDGSARC
ncbi:hypothetical protein CVT25_015454 [Psilocybe cyanescens]|uniref:Uncharacterized protein n=1 Tax=Psilocybe cyanescens TaxID=93625 RepID=A0A409WHI3_PSICY|nr:hypothetical protein CVT25_015454 [Psilocybe cyanescens]